MGHDESPAKTTTPGTARASDGNPELPAWSAYQEEVAEFFRSLGLQARTNVAVTGARGEHDVDVLVEFTSAGIDVTWVVECKQWQRAIPKERVLVLVGVVEDTGADRGLIVAESGIQGGAVRVASTSKNITLTSLDDLRSNTEEERCQSSVSGFAAQIHALQEDRRLLWDWTPPNAKGGPVLFDRMLEFAGEVLELHTLVLPKIISGSYPITFIFDEKRIANSATDLKPILTLQIDRVAEEADELFVLASAAAERAMELLAALEEDLADLVQFGRELAAQKPPHDAELAYVAARRAVGETMRSLGSAAPGSARHEVRALWRWLIDHTYVDVEESRADWDKQEKQFRRFVDRIRVAVDAAVARHWHQPEHTSSRSARGSGA